LRTHAHCAAHGLLHCAAEGDTLLQLGCDVLCNQLSVGVGVLQLDDGDLDRLCDHLAHLSLQLLDQLAALADNQTRTCNLKDDLNVLLGTLDLDCCNACVVQLLLQNITDVVVFHEEIAELCVLCEPTGIPILDYAYTET